MRYLTIQNTYDQVELALCTNRTIYASTTLNKIHASAECIPTLDALLKSHNLSMNDLSFIAANCGPGPFTTLRVVLTTVNGIHAASNIPLVGINALDALMQEYADTSRTTVALLNAFNNDVYYAINSTVIGCQNIATLLAHLAATYPQQPLSFIGNGARMHQALITQTFGSYAHIPNPLPETASLDQIQRMGFDLWEQKKGQATPLTPYYLKNAHLHSRE